MAIGRTPATEETRSVFEVSTEEFKYTFKENKMQAILLAGGLGTRLRSVVSDRPKPMALIQEKPFMEYVKDGSDFGFHAAYAYEETLLGTAGAIKNAGKFITEDRFFVLNADTFYQIDYTRLVRQQDEQQLDMALVLRRVPDVSRYGQAVLDEKGILTGFNEKTQEAESGTINGGIYLMKKSLLDEIPEGKVSLENDRIPCWLSEGKRLGGFVNDGYFIDIGIPEAYFQFQRDVETGVVR